MTTYLRHTPTGDLYVFTSALAKRKDMELVEELTEATPAETKDEQKPKAKGGRGKKKDAAPPVEESVVEPEIPVDDVDELEDLEIDVPLSDETGD